MSADETAGDEDGFVAVIGMAGRFPGADSVHALWRNLCDGVESVAPVPDPTGGEAAAAYGALAHADEFDSDFFGYSPADALIIDPQQRVFLECAHEALEQAGYGDPRGRAVTGVFAGGATTDYRLAVEAHLPELPFVDRWQVRLATAPDFLATRVAHKLRLTGPAVAVQTACSTSLVAVHLACQSLLAGDCQLALAGGAAVHVPPPLVAHTDGGIISADGHCRAFDAAATGTVGGSAAAVVVLKPLPDALADGDPIHAVIRGSAVNNDGGDGIGFTAPSVAGQSRVVRAAQLVAGVAAESIGYLEAHGTGTRLGDPIEVAALTAAARATTTRRRYCAIGSVKSNIGHTDAAAGVTGLIKAVLAVEQGLIPPSLHVSQPNPEIDWDGSPFEVNTTLRPWPLPGPRRAGVNSLGVGGTNAHVVVEQPPPRAPTPPPQAPQLLLLSAATGPALAEAGRRLAAHLAEQPETNLADAAWTLQIGRQHHRQRRYVVAGTTARAAAALTAPEPAPVGDGTGEVADGSTPEVVFMFTGQGGQYVGMGRDLYQRMPAFRTALDECAALAGPAVGLDLRQVLFPPVDDPEAQQRAERQLATIAVGQPAVFAVEYALTQVLLGWGLAPAAVVGHSLGAYCAAVVAGVMPLPDAMDIVVQRGQLLQALPAGAMAGVALPASELEPMLPPELSIGAVNGPRRCAIAGAAAQVRTFADELQRRGVDARVLPIATAGHSPLVAPITAEFQARVQRHRLRPPELAFLSDTTGAWAGPELGTAGYWATHLRAPVRFDRALAALGSRPGPRVLVEVGPGRTLVTLARQHPDLEQHPAVQTMPHPQDDTDALDLLLDAVGRLWLAGVPADWPRLHQQQPRRRLALPAYPYQRQRYLVPPPEPARAGAAAVVMGGTVEAGAPASPNGDRPEEGALQAAVRAAFAGALGLPGVSAHDDLFGRGGDSLTAARLAAWLRDRFTVPIRAADVVRARTAAGCVRLVEQLRAGAVQPAVTSGTAPAHPQWWSRRRPVADPRCRLYCLPHSGGAAGEYLRWADAMPEIEVWGANLPGRGARREEPALTSMAALAEAIVASTAFKAPFVLFGHSFGALLAYHVAQELRSRGGVQPWLLVLSAHPPPHLERSAAPVSQLADEELLRQLRGQDGGVPDELGDDPDLAALALPGYRADLAILESYVDDGSPPLDVPLVVITGEDDSPGPETLAQWRRHTTAECAVRVLPGGHFYFRQQPEPLLALLRDLLNVSAGASEGS